MQIEAVAEGYDPTVGIMHKAKKGSPAYALDLMESLRSPVESAIFSFLQDETFCPEVFRAPRQQCLFGQFAVGGALSRRYRASQACLPCGILKHTVANVCIRQQYAASNRHDRKTIS
jgi:CRISPR/Cas system-associated endonuclease Cas1